MTDRICSPRVLVADPDRVRGTELAETLSAAGYPCQFCVDGETALRVIAQGQIEVLLADFNIHRFDGLQLLARARQSAHPICVILFGNTPPLSLVTEAMRAGAWDVFTRPVSVEELQQSIRQGTNSQPVLDVVRMPDRETPEVEWMGISPAANSIRDNVYQIAPSKTTCLITGETGTGKSLLAKLIHNHSARAHCPFVTISCAALADAVIESELFGHVRGSFTGAVEDRLGKFEIADGGTLFLDEIGDMGLRVQAKLLRAIQEKSVERVGDTTLRQVDVRVVCATHHDLEDLVARGLFRQDLYYRLSVVNVVVPPLRERPEDIPGLVEHLLKLITTENNISMPNITREALRRMMHYHWPGNVRQLRNALENMVVLSHGASVLDVLHLPAEIRDQSQTVETVSFPIGTSMDEVERVMIERSLRACGRDKTSTARMLGMSLRTLYRKMKFYHLS